METLAYGVNATYIKALAKESEEKDYGVQLDFEEGTFLVWVPGKGTEVFRALDIGGSDGWCLRGNPAYYEREPK